MPAMVQTKARGMSDVDGSNLITLKNNMSNMIELQLQRMKSTQGVKATSSQGAESPQVSPQRRGEKAFKDEESPDSSADPN